MLGYINELAQQMVANVSCGWFCNI